MQTASLEKQSSLLTAITTNSGLLDVKVEYPFTTVYTKYTRNGFVVRASRSRFADLVRQSQQFPFPALASGAAI
jgi:hypothetical protein